jgi:hypothetical protein
VSEQLHEVLAKGIKDLSAHIQAFMSTKFIGKTFAKMIAIESRLLNSETFFLEIDKS